LEIFGFWNQKRLQKIGNFGTVPKSQKFGKKASFYHILAEQINDLTGRDMYFRYGDQQFRRSHVFLDFLCMDGDEVSSATLCPTTQCTTCWCPKSQLSDPDLVFPFRDTEDVRERVAAERKNLLHRDGRPRDRCKERVLL